MFMKYSRAQRHVLGRTKLGLSLTADLYEGKGSQSRTSGRWRTIQGPKRRGLLDETGAITAAGRAACCRGSPLMSVAAAFWVMIGLGALCALILAGCCLLVAWLLPRPKRGQPMSATPYPLPRETRESTVLAGNGTVGPYGPSLYRIFDTADVRVMAKALGETAFSNVTDACAITKTANAGYDTFSVTFGAAEPATTAWYHQAKRTSARSR
jgi:hypothetical protein